MDWLWILLFPGNYTKEFGGVQTRGKRTFGICLPNDVVDEETGATDSEVE